MRTRRLTRRRLLWLNDRLAGQILIGVAGLLCFPTIIFGGALAQVQQDAAVEAARQNEWWFAQATAQALARRPARPAPSPSPLAVLPEAPAPLPTAAAPAIAAAAAPRQQASQGFLAAAPGQGAPIRPVEPPPAAPAAAAPRGGNPQSVAPPAAPAALAPRGDGAARPAEPTTAAAPAAAAPAPQRPSEPAALAPRVEGAARAPRPIEPSAPAARPAAPAPTAPAGPAAPDRPIAPAGKPAIRFGTGNADDEAAATRRVYGAYGHLAEPLRLDVAVEKPAGASNSSQTVTVRLLKDGKPVNGNIAQIVVRYRLEDVTFTGRPNRPDGSWVMLLEVGDLTPGRMVPVEATTTFEGKELKGRAFFAP
jgi:hypothetical protein